MPDEEITHEELGTWIREMIYFLLARDVSRDEIAAALAGHDGGAGLSRREVLFYRLATLAERKGFLYEDMHN